jgi:hypothetical protein
MIHHTGAPPAAAGTGLCPTGRTSAKIRDGIAAWMLRTYVPTVLYCTYTQCSGSVRFGPSGSGSVRFGPPGSESVIICTDPDPSINKQKK